MTCETQQPATGADLLLAAAAGDALGAATEFMTAHEASEVYPSRPGCFARSAWRAMQPGDATDDTQLTIATVQALTRISTEWSGDSIIRFLTIAFSSWLESSPPDAGMTLQRALQLGSMEAWKTYGSALATNGALMRAHAVSSVYATASSDLIRFSVLCGGSTHAAPESIWSCLYTNLLIANLQDGSPWTEVIRQSLDVLRSRQTQREVFESLADGFAASDVTGHWKAMLDSLPQAIAAVEVGALGVVGDQEGTAFETLQAAIAHNINGSDHLDIIWRAAVSGNDTDTVASVAGAIAGARGLLPVTSMTQQLRAGHSWGTGTIKDGWRGHWSLVEQLPMLA